MSVGHALLGVLQDGSGQRSQLARRVEKRLGPAWRMNSGQLYQTMDRLEKQGLVELVEKGPDDDDGRDVYAITDSGVTAFAKWFEQASNTTRLARRNLLIKIGLGGAERLEEVLPQIADYEQECVDRLRELTHKRDSVVLGGAHVRADHVVLRLGIEADIRQVDAELAWTRGSRETVRWLIEQDAIWPSAKHRSNATDPDATRRDDARDRLFERMAARNRRLDT